MLWSSGAIRRNKFSLCSQAAHNLMKLLGTWKLNQHNKRSEGRMHDSAKFLSHGSESIYHRPPIGRKEGSIARQEKGNDEVKILRGKSMPSI